MKYSEAVEKIENCLDKNLFKLQSVLIRLSDEDICRYNVSARWVVDDRIIKLCNICEVNSQFFVEWSDVNLETVIEVVMKQSKDKIAQSIKHIQERRESIVQALELIPEIGDGAEKAEEIEVVMDKYMVDRINNPFFNK